MSSIYLATSCNTKQNKTTRDCQLLSSITPGKTDAGANQLAPLFLVSHNNSGGGADGSNNNGGEGAAAGGGGGRDGGGSAGHAQGMQNVSLAQAMGNVVRKSSTQE